MRKIAKTIIILALFFGLHFQALAANTHSADFELDNSMSLSIADGTETGLDMTTDYSIGAWIKLETLPNTNLSIATKMFGNTGDGGYQFYVDANEKLTAYWYQVAGVTYGLCNSNTAFDADDLGVWLHVGVAVDVSAGTCDMWLNGSAYADTDSGTATGIIASAGDFIIGAVDKSTGDFASFYDGRIDDVRVYNTLIDWSSGYDEELVGDEGNLQGYWKVNNSLLDETANDNDLTNNNSVTFPEDPAFADAAAPVINNEQVIIFE